MDFGSLILKTESDEQIEESKERPLLTVDGKGTFPSYFLKS